MCRLLWCNWYILHVAKRLDRIASIRMGLLYCEMQIEQPDFIIYAVFLTLTLRLKKAQNFVSINHNSDIL